MAPPFKQAEFEITYGEGVSAEGSIIDLGVEKKILTKAGAYISYGDTRLGQGRSAAKAFLREHPDVAEQILAQIYEDAGVVFAGATQPTETPAAPAPVEDADLKPVSGNGRKAAAVSG
jgi:recombination protein RecA